MNRKTFDRVNVKDADEGLVELAFATFDETDRDGDVTMKGAFDEGAEVVISSYGHASWGPTRGASSVPLLPVGKGTIKTTDTEAIVEGRFFMDTTAGRETFAVVKELGALQEWSYGYTTLKSSQGEKDGERVRFLEKQQVFEVSPVLKGAGRTRTVATKSAGADLELELAGGVKLLDSELRAALDAAIAARYPAAADDPNAMSGYLMDYDPADGYAVVCVGPDDYRRVDFTVDDTGAVALADADTPVEVETTYAPKGRRFTDEFAAALAVVDGFVSRARALAAVRVKEGRVISSQNRERLTSLRKRLGEIQAEIDSLLKDTEPIDDKSARAIEREFLRFQRSRSTVDTKGVRT